MAYLLESPNPELRTARRRWRLAHPGLAEQLRPALRAPLTEDAGPHLGHPVSRRARVAVEIARSAGGHGSIPDLVELLRSSTTNSYLRSPPPMRSSTSTPPPQRRRSAPSSTKSAPTLTMTPTTSYAASP